MLRYCGGVITSRRPSADIRLSQTITNRMKIQRPDAHNFPEFKGCKDWMKPMMFIQYEVFVLFSIDFYGDGYSWLLRKFVATAGWLLRRISMRFVLEPTR